MKPDRTITRILATLVTLGVLSAAAPAAESASAEQERRARELEERVRQQEMERELERNARVQQEALRGQEESLRRLEEARARLEENSREVAKLSSELGRNYAWTYRIDGGAQRALLGVSVDNANGDRDGAYVRNVSPGGAAADAGIKVGDVITAIDGEDLTKKSDPARALVEKMQDVKADAKVKVDVLRDGKKMSFDVTARAAPQPFVFTPGGRGGEFRALGDGVRVFTPPGTGAVRVNPGRSANDGQLINLMLDGANRFGGMEFATVSDRLGDYFGVDSGVLVVRAGNDAPYGLQDGDVIISIDGRAPTDAQHAGRILRSYQPGEKVKLRVQRDRKGMDLNATAPGTAPAQRRGGATEVR